MINKLEIAGVHFELDKELEQHVKKKIGDLDRYAPRASRKSMHVEVKLKGAKAKDKKESTCEVVMYLPKESLTASETTINMYAAVDLVEVKLKQQLKKYKDTHADPKFYRRLSARLRRDRNPVDVDLEESDR